MFYRRLAAFLEGGLQGEEKEDASAPNANQKKEGEIDVKDSVDTAEESVGGSCSAFTEKKRKKVPFVGSNLQRCANICNEISKCDTTVQYSNI